MARINNSPFWNVKTPLPEIPNSFHSPEYVLFVQNDTVGYMQLLQLLAL